MTRLASVLVLFAVASVLAATLAGSGAEPLYAEIRGPAALAPGQLGSYNVSLLGGPIGTVNYTVAYHITGVDVTGGSPLPSSPAQATANVTRIRLNITAPQREQTITLVATVSARSGGTVENTTVERTIVVITPIVLAATFRNSESTAALNVTVRFLVDNVLVGTQSIARIEPNGQAIATFNYLPVGLQPGPHSVRVEADLDGNGIVEPAKGEAFVSEIFYRETPPLDTGWSVLIGIAVFIPVFLVTVAVRRRERT
jgi:hypothetical protein